MNKQELIGILEGLEGDSFIEKYNEGYDQAVRDCLIAVKQLDESKKTVLPKKADDFIKEGEGLGSDKVDIIDSAISFARAMPNYEFSLWFKSNRNLFVNALANGYEVEKDQLYKVVIDHKYLVQLFSGRTDARLVEYEELTNWHDSAYKLTESVIKSIDERYWPFAVKVEGE
ncbi:DUF1642 domain-containing protein [Enterococcus faecalis]|nr:DUF1642 domain-containing protein [Enterococcus faecalis]HED5714278.1 DUF1642 domain-containing protein [Campylobacter jejuni]EGO7586666.1 DUF1642 domain-containing protein [Enterococcus faecalis]EGO7771686.1 DUF1642 domain-containing protein [Enterococcus faecalis]EIA1375201.1 DUF1642 domain-containing protein [Enterococcus faecalis]EJM6125913.1 DUF1642 domain-containing protein [Enterococcus faecalis]